MVSTPVRQHIGILDAQGVSWRRMAREVGVSRQTVGKYAELGGGLLAQAARTREGEVEAGPVQAGDRQVVGVGPVDAAQAAPYRDASLAPAAG